jgi:hypothetical protein
MEPEGTEPVATVSEKSPFLSKIRLSKRNTIIIALIFGVIGGIIIWRGFAQVPVIAALEAEQMSVPSGASIINDSSASGGKALKLTAAGTTSGSVNLPGNATSIALTAKGNKCQGPSRVNVLIDGVTLLSNAALSNNWQNYPVNTNLKAGSHTLSIVATNATSCRSVFLDDTIFYGSSTVTPAPTVALSASPSSVTTGNSSTLTWNSTNASSCTASGSWSGNEPASGSVSTGAINTTSVFNLSCTGTGGSASASATVTVTTATSAGSIYWGAYINGSTYGRSSDAPWDLTTWDLFESHAGKKVSIEHYGQPPMWEQAWASGPANNVVNRGAIPLIDMSSKSVPLADIASGKYDSSIGTWASAVKSWGKPFFFRWNWEMNGTWFSWGAQAKQNPAAFVAAWKHMHDVVASKGATNVTWVWCPNVEFTGSTALSSLYPGDAYVDWTCMDGYNRGPLDNDSWRSFSQTFQTSYNDILKIAPTKPVMIAETASNENGGSKAAWITDALQTQLPANYPKIKAMVWFNWPIYENNATQQWPIESSQTAQAAFAQGIASPYYASNGFGNLQPLTTVQPIR